MFKGKQSFLTSKDCDTKRFLETTKLLTEDWLGKITKGTAYFEGYAFGAKGQLTRIAESTGTTKTILSLAGWEIKTVTPNEIKKLATGIGNANKEKMAEAWYEEFGWYMHEQCEVKINDSPSTDIIDAWFAREYGKEKEDGLQ